MISYKQIQIILHLIIAFVFLIDILKVYLPIDLYKFIIKNKDIIFGIYYIYLGYNIYISSKLTVID